MKHRILSHQVMQDEILASHARSRQMNIDLEKRSPFQKHLNPKQLAVLLEQNQDLLSVADPYINEIYELLSPEDFIIAVVDHQGYILRLCGAEKLRNKFAEKNFYPGFRFSEKDVGTTATSLCLARKIPVQLNDKDHFCLSAHNHTSSAAPIFGENSELKGALVVSGFSCHFHAHTLIMVVSAARSIEKQIHLEKHNRDLSLYSNFITNIIESASTGLLILDMDLNIWKTNRKARQILRQQNLKGQPITTLGGLSLDLDDLFVNPDKWHEKEAYIDIGKDPIHIVYSVQPVLSETHQRLGAVINFEESVHIKKLSDKLSSSRPYFTFEHLISASSLISRAINLALKAARTHSTVLLLGDTGTGKEIFAQAIHNAGPHRNSPFIPVNCGAIPGELMESELFGYVDGAFTGALKGGRPGKFELADGGTLLLDEIGDMPHAMQVKLLRVLQTGEVQRIGSSKSIKVNVRIIAATNIDLLQATQLNRFRSDLYYRLNIISIKIPPLKDRGEADIRALARHFVNKHNPSIALTASAMKTLCAYAWPGNVRELENTIELALHLCDGVTIRQANLGLPEPQQSKPVVDVSGTLQQMEARLIAATLEKNAFNMAQTAKQLGISRATLYRKVDSMNLVKK